VLRRYVGASAGWTMTAAGAWLVGVAIPVIALSIVPDGTPAAVRVAVAVVAAVGMGVTVGAITRPVLERIVRADDERRANLSA